MFLMTSIYFLSTPEYLIGGPKKETNLKIQSMGKKKSMIASQDMRNS